jgi:hypothetical protein
LRGDSGSQQTFQIPPTIGEWTLDGEARVRTNQEHIDACHKERGRITTERARLEDLKKKGQDVNKELLELAVDELTNEFALGDYERLAKTDGNDSEAEIKIKETFTIDQQLDAEMIKIHGSNAGETLKDKVTDNKATEEDLNTLFREFYKTYKADRETNYWMSIGGLIAGLIGLALAASGLGYAVESDKKKKFSDAAGDNNSGSWNASLAGVMSTAQQMSAYEVEDMMQRLIVNTGAIASGAVPQERLWRNLATVADEMEIEDQNTTMILLQRAAVNLPGMSEFFWLDSNDTKERYEALRAAYKKSKKLSDVYLAATTIKYRNKEVPTFHMALLLQCALDLIKHDILFPDTPEAARA